MNKHFKTAALAALVAIGPLSMAGDSQRANAPRCARASVKTCATRVRICVSNARTCARRSVGISAPAQRLLRRQPLLLRSAERFADKSPRLSRRLAAMAPR